MTGARRPPALTAASGLALAEMCGGAGLLLFAGPLLQSVEGESVDRQVIDIGRVLGARQLLQGLIMVRRPTRRILRIGAAVDALHAATMLLAAATDNGPRRLTLASATLAGAFSAAGLTQSRRRRPGFLPWLGRSG